MDLAEPPASRHAASTGTAGIPSALRLVGDETQPILGLIEPTAPNLPLPDAAPADGSGKAVLRGSSWNTVAQIVPLIINIILTPYVIDGLGKPAFGLFILSTSIADFLGTFDGGFYSSAQRYFSIYAGRNDNRATGRLFLSLSMAVLGLGAIMATILTVAAPVLIGFFRVPVALRADGEFILRVLGIVIALELLRGVFAGIINARQRFSVTSGTTITQYLIYTGIVIATLRYHWGLHGIALALLAQAAVSTAILGLAASRYLARSDLRFMPRREITEFLRYSSRAQVSGLSDLINLQSDSLIVGGFINLSSVALYNSGRNFATQMRSLPWNAIAPAATSLGHTYGEQGAEAVLVQFRRLQRLWVQACSGWIAVGAAAAYFGVTRWLPAGYRLAGVVAVVLLIGYAFRLWAGMMTVFCQTTGHPELEARYGVVSVVVNLVLTLALVVPFGVLGVVAATALGQLVGSIYLLRVVRSRLSADIPSFFDEVPWLASAIAAAVTVGLELPVWNLFHRGALGLLEAGVVAAPGLLVFAVLTFGPRQVWQILRGRLRPMTQRTPYNYQPRHRLHMLGVAISERAKSHRA
jgi:O-antigen/teichoic acid export membrane protein